MWNWYQLQYKGFSNIFLKNHWSISHLYLPFIHDFLASKIGHIENIGSLIYAGLINVSIFHYIL